MLVASAAREPWTAPLGSASSQERPSLSREGGVDWHGTPEGWQEECQRSKMEGFALHTRTVIAENTDTKFSVNYIFSG